MTRSMRRSNLTSCATIANETTENNFVPPTIIEDLTAQMEG